MVEEGTCFGRMAFFTGCFFGPLCAGGAVVNCNMRNK